MGTHHARSRSFPDEYASVSASASAWTSPACCGGSLYDQELLDARIRATLLERELHQKQVAVTELQSYIVHNDVMNRPPERARHATAVAAAKPPTAALRRAATLFCLVLLVGSASLQITSLMIAFETCMTTPLPSPRAFPDGGWFVDGVRRAASCFAYVTFRFPFRQQATCSLVVDARTHHVHATPPPVRPSSTDFWRGAFALAGEQLDQMILHARTPSTARDVYAHLRTFLARDSNGDHDNIHADT